MRQHPITGHQRSMRSAPRGSLHFADHAERESGRDADASDHRPRERENGSRANGDARSPANYHSPKVRLRLAARLTETLGRLAVRDARREHQQQRREQQRQQRHDVLRPRRMMVSSDRMRRCHEGLPCPGRSFLDSKEAWFGPAPAPSSSADATRSRPISLSSGHRLCAASPERTPCFVRPTRAAASAARYRSRKRRTRAAPLGASGARYGNGGAPLHVAS